jgi:ABC-type antimicrobial peptide transport system permease subunit
MRKLTEAAPRARVQEIDLLERRYFGQLARPRLSAALAMAFAVTTLLAAAAGLFSLLSHAVVRRRREFGIRAALGASPAAVRSLVWREGLTVTLAGIGLGTIAGLSITRVISALLYDVTVADPLSWVIVAGVLVVTIAVASWLPARVAARATPVTLLRDE